jgi:hypothetical protein
MEQTPEMEIGYTGGDFTDDQVVSLPMAMPADVSADPSVVIGAPQSEAELSQISVFAQSINAVSYQQDSPIAAFDVVFSVSIINSEGCAKTYQVVKRIGVDRMKIAQDAESSTPVSIVEAKQPEQPIIAEAHLVSKARALAIAGIKVRI